MEHVVFFPAPDGSPAFRRVPSLEEAVRLVEHLRNVEGVATAAVHALTEVPLSFRAYYRVEVPGATAAASGAAAVTAPVTAPVRHPFPPVVLSLPAQGGEPDAEPEAPRALTGPARSTPALSLVERPPADGPLVGHPSDEQPEVEVPEVEVPDVAVLPAERSGRPGAPPVSLGFFA